MCRFDEDDDIDDDDDRSSTPTQAQQVLSSSQLNEALIAAVCEGSILKVQYLLDQHADIHTRNGEMRETPLHLASKYGHHQCIELLLDRHADINARCWNSFTPLHDASFFGQLQCAELLIDHGADKSIVNVRLVSWCRCET